MAHDHGVQHNTPSVLTSSADGLLSTNTVNVDHGHHAGNNGDHGMSMAMFFHAGYTETILFSFWKIDTIGGLIGSMIGIFLMAMLYEGLKVLREYLLQRALQNEPLRHHRLDNKNGHRIPLDNNGIDGESPDGSTVNENTQLRPNPFSASHAVQTGLHMFQACVSYLLMLVFMTYNVWLSLAVILGAGAGYFAFGWRKRTVVDFNEHCH